MIIFQIMAVVALRKTKNPLSKVSDLMKSDFLLVRLRSLQEEIAGLKQTALFIKCSKQKIFETYIILLFCGVILKSSVSKELSYVLLGFAIASFDSLAKNSLLWKGPCTSKEEAVLL